MPINNDWVNNKNKNKKVNMNFDNDESSKGIYIIFILGIVATYFLYGYIEDIKVKEQEQIRSEINAYNQSVKEHNQKVLEQRQKEKLANQNNYNNSNTKDFKITTQYNQNNYSNITNMSMITNNLNKVKSNINDNNYKIEISGRISSYGNMIYKIYRTNGNANIYDSKFTEVMEELKKYTFKVNNNDLDFNITIHNNSYNLN